jgi:hypothetical protein
LAPPWSPKRPWNSAICTPGRTWRCWPHLPSTAMGLQILCKPMRGNFVMHWGITLLWSWKQHEYMQKISYDDLVCQIRVRPCCPLLLYHTQSWSSPMVLPQTGKRRRRLCPACTTRRPPQPAAAVLPPTPALGWLRLHGRAPLRLPAGCVTPGRGCNRPCIPSSGWDYRDAANQCFR